MGSYQNEQRGFCLPGTSEDSIALHQCHRTHRRNASIDRGQLPATEKELNHHMAICNNMMHAMTWQYECVLG